MRKLKIFTPQELAPIVGSVFSAKKIITEYRKKKLICRLFNNHFAFIDPKTKTHTLSKFEIGSCIIPCAHICYYTALEYHGIAWKPSNTVYFWGEKRPCQINIDGICYLRSRNVRCRSGIYSPSFDSLIWVTDLERTIIDCLDCNELVGGMEGVIRSLCKVTYLDEKKLKLYLDEFNKPMLYRKAGCILSFFKETAQISDEFFDDCWTKINDGVYKECSSKEPRVHIRKWRVYLSEKTYAYLALENSERIRLFEEKDAAE